MFKIMIVDDNDLNRDVLRELFITHFQSVVVEEAANGRAAMEKLEVVQPDLILMDIRLPDVSGLRLTRRIKGRNPNIKVLIFTAHYDPEYEEAAARYGADGFLVKGTPSKDILATIESLLR